MSQSKDKIETVDAHRRQKRPRRLTRGKTSSYFVLSQADDGASVDPSAEFKPSEVLTIMSYFMGQAGHVIGVHMDSYPAIKNFLDSVTAELQRNSEAKISDFGERFLRTLQKIRALTRRVLTIPKSTVGVQTDPFEYADVEVQTRAPGARTSKK